MPATTTRPTSNRPLPPHAGGKAKPDLRSAILRLAITCTIAGAIVAVAMGPVWRHILSAAASAGDLRLRFEPGLLIERGFAVQVHVGAALTALAIGGFMLVRPKGGGLHRTLGWTWVVAMATTAASSLWLRDLNHGAFSFIHLLSGWVLVALPMAVAAIRRRNVRLHQRMMLGLYMGGLVFTGLLTFIPGRLMWSVFFG